MERIRQWWSIIRIILLATAGASIVTWFVVRSQFPEEPITQDWTNFGFLVLGWALLYLAAQRVMLRLYCPLRKVQSILLIAAALATIYPISQMLESEQSELFGVGFRLSEMINAFFHDYTTPFTVLFGAAAVWTLLMVYFQFNPTLGQKSISWDDQAAQ